MSQPASHQADRFFKAVLDCLTEHIAAVAIDGAIRYVNRPWLRFCAANDGPSDIDWTGVNYLDVCDAAAAQGDEYGRRAREGFEALAANRLHEYSLEYPCHGPTELRWFLAHMTAMEIDGSRYIVVSHHNITQRKLAEDKAEWLARTDGLTGVANRKHLDQFLDQEWRRAARIGGTISVLLLDIDFFKSFNDHYGHPAGDDCLRRLAAALQEILRRPQDLVARYGGEEFMLVLGQSSLDNARSNAERALEAIRALEIPHEYSRVSAVITASMGVATMVPARDDEPAVIIERADEALYRAKREGRDRFCIAGSDESKGPGR